jgi:hypothetical protein
MSLSTNTSAERPVAPDVVLKPRPEPAGYQPLPAQQAVRCNLYSKEMTFSHCCTSCPYAGRRTALGFEQCQDIATFLAAKGDIAQRVLELQRPNLSAGFKGAFPTTIPTPPANLTRPSGRLPAIPRPLSHPEEAAMPAVRLYAPRRHDSGSKPAAPVAPAAVASPQPSPAPAAPTGAGAAPALSLSELPTKAPVNTVSAPPGALQAAQAPAAPAPAPSAPPAAPKAAVAPPAPPKAPARPPVAAPTAIEPKVKMTPIVQAVKVVEPEPTPAPRQRSSARNIALVPRAPLSEGEVQAIAATLPVDMPMAGPTLPVLPPLPRGTRRDGFCFFVQTEPGSELYRKVTDPWEFILQDRNPECEALVTSEVRKF